MTTSNTPRPTKAERRESAREQARLLREAQEKRERRNRLLLIGGLVVAVALIAVAVFSIIGAGQTKDLADVAAPANTDGKGGVIVGADGVGTATEGAPVVDVYADFMCPVCSQFEEINGPMLEELRQSGQATLQMHPVAILDRFSEGTAYSTRSAQAAAVVADAAPEQFLAFWQALFDNQPAENTPGLSDEEIAGIAVDAGVPQAVADTFTEGRFTDWVTAATELAATEHQPFGTPTVIVDGTKFEGDWSNPENLRAAIVGDAAPSAEPSELATTPAG
jgi:protein-disulfide isomerase